MSTAAEKLARRLLERGGSYTWLEAPAEVREDYREKARWLLQEKATSSKSTR